MKFNLTARALLLCPLVFGGMFLAQHAVAQQPPPPAEPAKPVPPQAEPPKPAPPATAPPKSQAGQSTFEDIESVWSISVFGWAPDSRPKLRGGQLSPDPPAQQLNFTGNTKRAPGIVITFPTGRSNRFEISGWETRTRGSQTLTATRTFFAETYDRGTFLETEQRVRGFKGSWNYLSYPYPPLDSKFRIKTLWEVQYIQVRTHIVAPFTARPETEDEDAVPATESNNKKTIILPTFGVGFEYIPSQKHFRLEARGSGFGLPGKSIIWDAQAEAVLRFGNLELFGGGKAFHYRSSPKSNQYVFGTLWGPLVGVRWVFR